MRFRFGSKQSKDARKPSAEGEERLVMKNPVEGKFIAYFPEEGSHAAYWKVSSSTGTTRVFGDRTDAVPDSALRQGETDDEWRMGMLVRDLQAMASDPETLIAAFGDGVPSVTDLVNDFLIRLEFLSSPEKKSSMTQEIWNRLRDLEARVRQIPYLDDPSLSTVGSLQGSSGWTGVARLAREVLEGMGYAIRHPRPRSM